jgi:hypothetical protein
LTDDAQSRFDERGARLLRTRVFFSSKHLFSLEELDGKKLLTRREPDGTWWSDFYLLPTEMHAGSLYVAVTLHSHPPHDLQYWELAYALAPADSPPSYITRATYDGAFPSNLHDLVAKAFPTGEPSSVSVQVHYELDPVNFRKQLERLGIYSTINREGGISMRPKSSEWGVHGAKHLTSVSVVLADADAGSDAGSAGDQPRLGVVVRATMDVKLSETTHHEVDGQVWQELTSCLG